MTEYVELYIDRGSDFSTVITLQDDFTGLHQNITSYNVTSALYRSVLSPNLTANLTCTLSDPGNGEFQMTMTASNTANLKIGKYFLYVHTQYANERQRLLEGVVFVS